MEATWLMLELFNKGIISVPLFYIVKERGIIYTLSIIMFN